jgi:ADP-ribosylglycohydrolase
MNKKILRDKILGCFNGKNVGGTLGAPLEGKNGFFDIEYFIQPNIENNPLPNDDLDLQISSLNAVRRFGKNVNSEILAEYYNIYVNPSWAEYGVGKSNLRRGIPTPISGYHANSYKDSCGSFIRSEIWACLCPAHPELAARYAYFDSSIDHADEGTYGEVFWAAMQSAAFCESDIKKLIDIGLSYIPKESALYKGISLVVDCYESGRTWEEARDLIFREIPGAFSYQHTKLKDIKLTEYTPAPAGFDAPQNIAIAIMGLLYGEGDFGRSMLIAVNCGEDADCTAGSLASTLGIILGNSNLPEKWIKPINDVIVTATLNTLDYTMTMNTPFFLPRTTQELADEIIKCIPKMLPVEAYDITDDGLEVFPKDGFYCKDNEDVYYNGAFGNRALECFNTTELLSLPHYSVFKELSLFKVQAIYENDFFFENGRGTSVKLKIYDNGEAKIQHWLTIRAYSYSGVEIKEKACTVPLGNCNGDVVEKTFHITPTQVEGDKFDVIFDISMEGHASMNLIKVSFFAK